MGIAAGQRHWPKLELGEMADAHAKHHDYHLVDPSPWPAVGGLAAFILAVGAMHVISRRHGGYLADARRLSAVLYTMIMWWRDVVNEAEHRRTSHTRSCSWASCAMA